VKSLKYAFLFHNDKLEDLNKRKARLENELKGLERARGSARAKLSEPVKGAESLERLGTEKISKLASFAKECEKLGYSVGKLVELARLVDKKEELRGSYPPHAC
jgi:predicted nuclease with TOPRIM domain